MFKEALKIDNTIKEEWIKNKRHEVISLVVAMEELGELQKEISKQIRGINNIREITEEIADVIIILQAIQLIVGIDDTDILLSKLCKELRILNKIKSNKLF